MKGLTPTLAELVALRASVSGRRVALRGAVGVAGASRSSLRGRGMEYAESREYTPGDDARHIDWRLTARTGRAHTKLFQAERERLTLLLADTAPGLYFGTRTRFKSVQAARAGAVAAWRAVADGDRIAALRGTQAEPPVSPGAGARGALRVLSALQRWYSQPPADDAGLSVGLDHAQRLLRPGSRLLVLADGSSLQHIASHRLAGLAVHHEVIVLVLTDALEHAPPALRLPFHSMDAAGRIELDLRAESQRQRWQQQFAQPLEAMLQQLRNTAVRVQCLPTDADSAAWLSLLARTQAAVA